MMRIGQQLHLVTFLVAMLILPMAAEVHGKEIAKRLSQSEDFARSEISRKMIVALHGFETENLEQQARHYRENRVRTPSGIWALSVFYNSVKEYIEKPTSADLDAGYPRSWRTTKDVWRDKYPKSPTLHILSAVQAIGLAWRIRGGAYAHKVWPDSWKGFFALMSQARDILENSRSFASHDPHWYTARIEVAMSLQEGHEKVIELLREAVAREPYYYQTYFVTATALHPSWGGDWQLIDYVSDWAVEQTKEQDGQSLFARINRRMYRDPSVVKRFADTENYWPKLKSSIVDLLERYPNIYNVESHILPACWSHNDKAVEWLRLQAVRYEHRDAASWKKKTVREICGRK